MYIDFDTPKNGKRGRETRELRIERWKGDREVEDARRERPQMEAAALQGKMDCTVARRKVGGVG